MKDRLNFEARYPHPPADVWRALTDPESLAKWLLPNDFQPTLGGAFEFRSVDGKQRIACEVLELEPGKRLAFRWDAGEDEPPAVVSWNLQPDGDGGTHLTLEHRLLEEAEPYVLLEAGMNWRNALRRMPIPIVYMEDQPEQPNTRLAGFRIREVQEEATACK